MRIDGTRILITGATGGVGQSIARTLHRAGAELVITGRQGDRLAALAQELGGATTLPCDLADAAEVDRLIAAVGDVDAVIANAALPAAGWVEEFTTEELDRALMVNFRAPMVVAQRLLPGMQERGRGHFVFISSIGGKIPTGRLSVYAATKFGLRGFSGSLRQDLAGTGVSSSVVFPGSVIDAAMLVDAHVGIPRGTKGVTAQQVADGVVRAIEDDIAEIDVADFTVRAAARLVGLFPRMAGTLGSQKDAVAYAEELAEGLGSTR